MEANSESSSSFFSSREGPGTGPASKVLQNKSGTNDFITKMAYVHTECSSLRTFCNLKTGETLFLQEKLTSFAHLKTVSIRALCNLETVGAIFNRNVSF